MSSPSSLVLYIVAFLVSVMFVYLGNREKVARLKIVLGSRYVVINPSLIVGVTIPILVAGLRQNVGTDFNNYVTEYNAAIQGGSYLEASFNIIANLSSALFNSPTLMFFIFSTMTVIPVMLGINKSTAVRKEYRWLFWALFLFIMFPQTLNMLRQGVSVAIGFYLIVSVIESRRLFRLSHFMYLLLAASFHSSAWILLPIAYVAHILNNRKTKSLIVFIFIFSVLAAVCLSVLPQLLGWLGLGVGYAEGDLVSRSVVPRSLLIIFIIMMCWKFYDVLKITNSYTSLLYVGLLLGVGGLFVSYFERAGYYITLLMPLLVLTIIAQSTPVSHGTVIKFGLCLFALIYFVGVYYLMGSSGIFPYNWSVQS